MSFFRNGMCHHFMPVVYGRLAFRPACVFVGKIKGTNCAVCVHSHSPYIPLRRVHLPQSRHAPSRLAVPTKTKRAGAPPLLWSDLLGRALADNAEEDFDDERDQRDDGKHLLQDDNVPGSGDLRPWVERLLDGADAPPAAPALIWGADASFGMPSEETESRRGRSKAVKLRHPRGWGREGHGL